MYEIRIETMSYEMAKAVDQLFSQDPADEVAGSEKKGVSFVKSRSEAVGFPKAWYREELIKSGSGVVNPGHKIVHYYRYSYCRVCTVSSLTTLRQPETGCD